MSQEVPIEWKFHPKFEDLFLDIWYESYPEIYNLFLEEAGPYGSDMIIALSDINEPIFKVIKYKVMPEMAIEMRPKDMMIMEDYKEAEVY